ncbi:MAG: hypothetical protein ACOYMW_06460 [Candidatus Competibacteraceae bacterium]
MKTSLVGSMIVLGAASLTASAEEFSWGNVVVHPRAYMGYANYSLESGDMTYIRQNAPPQTKPLQFDVYGNSKIEFTGPIFGLGAIVAVDRFFGDVYYQSTLSETAYSGSKRLDGSKPPPVIFNLGDVNAKNADWALSLGYRITDQWSVFAGYKRLSKNRVIDLLSGVAGQNRLEAGPPLNFSSKLMANFATVSKSGKTDWDQSMRVNVIPPTSMLVEEGKFAVNFDQDGPFVGTAYSFFMGPGALTVKAAYAYLDGSYKSNFDSLIFGAGGNYIPLVQQFEWDGTSNAFSFGVSWTQSATNNLGYSVGANYHHYQFDSSGSKQFITTFGNQIVDQGILQGGNLTEDLFTLTASLLYTF